MDNINKKEDKKLQSRKKRGQINSEDLKPFKNFKSNDLIIMLFDEDSQKRTIAATLLNKKSVDNVDNIYDINDKEDIIDLTDISDITNITDTNYSNNEYIISSLAKSFKKEKSLYSRIAMSNSLASYGKDAVPQLIQLLGEIGTNQEKELPKKYFNKKSFPLPRDLSARTLAMVGYIATPFLMEFIDNNNYNNPCNHYNNFGIDQDDIFNDIFKKEQALDAIGAIAYKYNDHRAFNSINNLYNLIISLEDINVASDDININEKYTNILIWKIVRSLSGFKNNENALNLVIDIQKRFANIIEIQWEAIRSIGRIGIVNDNIKSIFQDFNKYASDNINNPNDKDSQLKFAVSVSMESLGLS